MFFILSKLLIFLLSPLFWVFLTFLYAFFRKEPRAQKRTFLAGILLLLFFSNGFIVNEAFLLWEDEPIAINDLKNYETAIVLTGVTNKRNGSLDKVFFSKGADRLLHTVQLYKAGKIKRILISGGSSGVINKDIPEAGELKKVFIYCGIPESAIILEDQSRNTAESARLCKKLIDTIIPDKEFLLVTSAFHIPRSVACFEKAGLNVKPYPVDFYSNNRSLNPWYLLLPSEYALTKWSLLIHELCGYFVYRLIGYS